jgi:hypothetical protein
MRFHVITSLVLIFFSLSFDGVIAQTNVVKWGSEVTVHDEAIAAKEQEGGKVDPSVRFRRTYGSEYGRMLKLRNGAWLAAYTVSRNDGYQKDPQGGFQIEIARSRNNGKTWKKLSVIRDHGRDLDNAQMIQLPDGSILLSCRSVRWQESYRLPVYKSGNRGKGWKQISVIDANEGKPGELGKPDKGVYEPHLEMLGDGRLAVMYASEKHVTDSLPYSQIIAQKISPDFGKSWGSEIWVAFAPGRYTSRPGMPVWTKMKNGSYIAVYEICGPELCGVYFKTSSNGFTWAPGFGSLIPQQTGGPYILSLKDGTLVVTSNKGNLSLSSDGGLTWQLGERPWLHEVDFSKDWTQTIWSSLYQFNNAGLIAMTALKRKVGGHHIRIRFGQLGPGR